MTTPALNQPKIPEARLSDMQWILDDLLQSELMLMGLYADATEDDLLTIYCQYPSGLLQELLLQFTREEQYTCCNAIRQVMRERAVLARAGE